MLLGSDRPLPGGFFHEEQPGGSAKPNDQRDRHGPGRGKDNLVPAHALLEPIKSVGGTGNNGFMVKVTIDVHRQTVRRFVTVPPVFFQRLHYDPIQVSPQQGNQFGRFRLPVFGRCRQFRALEGGQHGRRPLRLLLPQRAPHLIQTVLQQFLGIERRPAGEQFV